jgi:glutamine amidotransferase
LSLNLGVIDYGMGNLHSVGKALERLGETSVPVHNPVDLNTIDALILPGVGSFDPAIDNLQATGLVPHLKAWAENNRPLLGICLGLQLLFERSDEGNKAGLGLFQGSVERLKIHPNERIPHMGWAPLKVERNCPLLHSDDPTPWVYFVHSYAAKPGNSSVLSATANFGNADVTAIVWSGRIGACQFHPEKSSSVGEAMLNRWIHWLHQGAEPVH